MKNPLGLTSAHIVPQFNKMNEVGPLTTLLVILRDELKCPTVLLVNWPVSSSVADAVSHLLLC